MAIDDFIESAERLLPILEDDPNRPVPDVVETTTFPFGGSGLEGEAVALGIPNDTQPAGESGQASDEDVEAGRRAYREAGIDTLAFYKSFRFREQAPFRGLWGIFLIDAGIGAVQAEFEAMAPALPAVELRELAVDTLLAHERYHFWIDAWALGQEILSFPRFKRYELYFAAKPNVSLSEYDFEESLANHYAYIRLKSKKLSDGSSAARLLRGFFDSCPKPYSDYSYSRQLRADREGLLAFAVSYGTCPIRAMLLLPNQEMRDIAVAAPSIRPAPTSHPMVGHHRCPVYELWTIGYAARVSPFQGPGRKEFREFIEQYLSGQKVSRTDHDYYRIDNGEKVKFPNSHDKEIRGYELKGILLKASMTQSEFRAARLRTKNWKINCPRSKP